MKKLIYATVFTLVIASTVPSAWARSPNDAISHSRSSVCDSVPSARPTGGATSIRLQVLQQCYKNTPPSTIQSAVGGCELTPARPTGGATLARLQILQECFRKNVARQ